MRQRRTKQGWVSLTVGLAILALFVVGGFSAIFKEQPYPQPWWSWYGWVRWVQGDPNDAWIAIVTAAASVVGGTLSVWGGFFAKTSDDVIAAVKDEGEASRDRDTLTHFELATLRTQNVQLAQAVNQLTERLTSGPGAQAAEAPDAPVEQARDALTAALSDTDPERALEREALRDERFEDAARLILASVDTAAATAAGRAREAGALAWFRNVGLAIQAYSRAAELDPSDHWTHVLLARLHLRAGNLHLTETAARRAFETAVDERGRCVGLDSIGNLLERRGDWNGAVTAYREIEAITRRLASDPQDRKAQGDLSVSLERVGSVLERRGDLEGALAAYREGEAIDRRLASDPQDVHARRQLFVSLNKVGGVLARRGDWEEALAAYREAESIGRKLAGNPQNIQAQRDLSVSLTNIGDVLVRRGDLEGALTAYREGEAIDRRLANDAQDAQAQRDLSVSLAKLGDVMQRRGDLDGALAAYHDSEAISRRLTADPQDAQAQRDLSVNLTKVGGARALRGDLEGALAAYREGEVIDRRLASDLEDAEAQHDLGVSMARIAMVLEAQLLTQEASGAWRETVDQFKRAVTLAPEDSDARSNLKAAEAALERLNHR